MSAEEKALKVEKIPAGLQNLGNTCYMNATLQCFRHMPELRSALTASVSTPIRSFSVPEVQMLRAQHSMPTAQSLDQAPRVLSACLGHTCNLLDGSGAPIVPHAFVSLLRTFNPTFDEVNQQGHHKQQDAEEFYTYLAMSLRSALPPSLGAQGFDALLGVTLEETMTCQETDLEPAVVSRDQTFKLICNISGGTAGTKVDHIHDGLKLALEGPVEKNSAVLGRNATWTKRARLASLPRYLCFQFMRFFWNQTPGSADPAGVKAKIMRAVQYPDVMDVYDYCTPALQEVLRANRLADDRRIDEELKAKRAKLSAELMGTGEAAAGGGAAAGEEPSKPAASGAAAAAAAAAMEVEGDELDEETRAAIAFSLSGELPPPPPTSASAPASASSSSSSPVSAFGPGAPADFLGYYELAAVVTHKGRSADSGHYIGWARKEEGSDQWFQFNDDKVSECSTADVLRLSGGGDHDTAYLNFYRQRLAKRRG